MSVEKKYIQSVSEEKGDIVATPASLIEETEVDENTIFQTQTLDRQTNTYFLSKIFSGNFFFWLIGRFKQYLANIFPTPSKDLLNTDSLIVYDSDNFPSKKVLATELIENTLNRSIGFSLQEKKNIARHGGERYLYIINDAGTKLSPKSPNAQQEVSLQFALGEDFEMVYNPIVSPSPYFNFFSRNSNINLFYNITGFSPIGEYFVTINLFVAVPTGEFILTNVLSGKGFTGRQLIEMGGISLNGIPFVDYIYNDESNPNLEIDNLLVSIFIEKGNEPFDEILTFSSTQTNPSGISVSGSPISVRDIYTENKQPLYPLFKKVISTQEEFDIFVLTGKDNYESVAITEGTYIIKSNLILPASLKEIKGFGNVLLKSDAASSNGYIIQYEQNVNVKYTRIENISFENIVFINIYNIENCNFFIRNNIKITVLFDQCNYISNCKIDYNGKTFSNNSLNSVFLFRQTHNIDNISINATFLKVDNMSVNNSCILFLGCNNIDNISISTTHLVESITSQGNVYSLSLFDQCNWVENVNYNSINVVENNYAFNLYYFERCNYISGLNTNINNPGMNLSRLNFFITCDYVSNSKIFFTVNKLLASGQILCNGVRKVSNIDMNISYTKNDNNPLVVWGFCDYLSYLNVVVFAGAELARDYGFSFCFAVYYCILNAGGRMNRSNECYHSTSSGLQLPVGNNLNGGFNIGF